MTPRTGLLIALLCSVLVATPSHAQSDPVVLFGVALDEPLSIPRCEASREDNTTSYFAMDNDVCWHPALDDDFDKMLSAEYSVGSVLMRPGSRPSYVRDDIHITTIGGKVVQISFQTYGEDSWDALEAALATKFGKPSFTHRFEPGLSYIHVSEWRMPSAKIEHQTFSKKPSPTGSVIATSQTLRDLYDRQRAEQRARELKL